VAVQSRAAPREGHAICILAASIAVGGAYFIGQVALFGFIGFIRAAGGEAS
jgi:hypothetical protein